MAVSQQEILAAAAKGGYDDGEEPVVGDRGDNIDEQLEEEQPEGEQPEGEQPEGDQPEGEQPEGEQQENEKPAKDDKNVELRVKKALSQRDEARRELQQLQERIAELEGKSPKINEQAAKVEALNAEIDALYEQVEEARAIADVKQAAALQRQLDSKKHQLVKAEAVAEAQRANETLSADRVHDQMLDHLEGNYTVLNPSSDEYDPALAREIQFNTDAFIKAGMAPPAALRRSTTLVFGFDPFAPRAARTEAPKPAAKPVDVKKAADVSARTPPAPGARGRTVDVQAIDPTKLSDEEFAALPESKKRALRGDF